MARRESDQRFRDIVEVSGDWIWETDAEHRFTFFSTDIMMRNGPIPPAASARRPGRPPAPMSRRTNTGRRIIPTSKPISRSAISCFPSSSPAGIAPPHLDERRAGLRQAAATFRGYRGTATDETPIVEAFWRAEEAEALLRDAVESISEGFVIFDAEDQIVMANEAFRKLYPEIADLTAPGMSFEELLRAAVERGIYPEARGHEPEWIATRLEAHQDSAAAPSSGSPTAAGYW